MTERPALDSSLTELGGRPQQGVNGPKPDASDETPTRRAGPWGPSASLGLTLVILMGMGGAQEVAAHTFAAHWMTFRSLIGSRAEAPSASQLTAVGILAGAFAAAGAVWLLAFASRYPVREYLAIDLPTGRRTALAVIGLAVFIVVNYSISWVLAQPLEPPAVVEIYRTGAHALFFVAAVEGGMSRREAAAHFQVGVSSAIRWVAQASATGDVTPKLQGGDRPSQHVEACADRILEMLEAKCDNSATGRFLCQVTFMSKDDLDERLYFDVVAVARTDEGWELRSGLCKR